jgi:hypothetical protein
VTISRDEQDEKIDLTAKYTGDLAIYTYWLMIATITLALVGLISLALTLWIAASTEDLKRAAASQLEEMQKSAKQVERSIDAANNQVTASKEANNILELSSRRQLQAYIMLEEHHTSGFPNILPQMYMKYTVKNVGQTPAYGVSSFKSEAFVPDSPDIVLEVPDPYGEKADWPNDTELSVIGAGLTQVYDRPDSQTHSNSDLDDFKRGKKAYMYWGVVYYKDIFKQDRYLRFCRYFSKGDLNGWFACKNHNDAN